MSYILNMRKIYYSVDEFVRFSVEVFQECPGGNYMIKVNDESSVILFPLKTSEMFSGGIEWICSDVSVVELIQHIILVFLLLTLTISSFHCLYSMHKKEVFYEEFLQRMWPIAGFIFFAVIVNCLCTQHIIVVFLLLAMNIYDHSFVILCLSGKWKRPALCSEA